MNGSERQEKLINKIDKLSWEKLYQKLEEIVAPLRSSICDNLNSYQESIQAGINTEYQAVKLHNWTSSLLAVSKSEMNDLKVIHKLRLKSLLGDPDNGTHLKTTKERALYIDACLVDEQKAVDDAQHRYDQLYSYLECVRRTLSQIRHYREDLGRKVRILCVQREISET